MASAAETRVANPIFAAQNQLQIGWLRTLAAVISASAVGIAGVTGALGFACYVIGHVAVQLLLLALHFKGAVSEYTGSKSGTLSWALTGVGENVLTFLVVWAFVYAVVHFF